MVRVKNERDRHPKMGVDRAVLDDVSVIGDAGCMMPAWYMNQAGIMQQQTCLGRGSLNNFILGFKCLDCRLIFAQIFAELRNHIGVDFAGEFGKRPAAPSPPAQKPHAHYSFP